METHFQDQSPLNLTTMFLSIAWSASLLNPFLIREPGYLLSYKEANIYQLWFISLQLGFFLEWEPQPKS